MAHWCGLVSLIEDRGAAAPALDADIRRSRPFGQLTNHRKKKPVRGGLHDDI
jgi:hypothetical protein